MQNGIFDYVRINSFSGVTKSNLLLLILIVANNAEPDETPQYYGSALFVDAHFTVLSGSPKKSYLRNGTGWGGGASAPPAVVFVLHMKQIYWEISNPLPTSVGKC